MRIRRDISSIPFRSADATWQSILELVTGSGSVDVQQLVAAGGVVSSIITDEHPASRAIIFEGVGPQLRLYCCYGAKSVEKGADVDVLTWNPTAGDWTAQVPCDAANIDWVRNALAKTSPRITVVDVESEDRATDDDAGAASGSRADLAVDWNLKG